MSDGLMIHLFEGHEQGGYQVIDSGITLCCHKHVLGLTGAGTVNRTPKPYNACPEWPDD